MKLRSISTPILVVLFLSADIVAGCKEKANDPPVAKGNDKNFTFKKEGEVIFSKADSTQVKKIDVEIAETDAEKQQGLMNRPWMEETQGMIFLFDKNEPQAFWMRNTIIPLDIIYVNSSWHIVSIAENAQPFSEKSIPSKGNAQYVVEVVAGFCEKYGIVAGDMISFSRQAM